MILICSILLTNILPSPIMRNILHCLWACAGRGWQREGVRGGAAGQAGGWAKEEGRQILNHQFAAAQSPTRNCSSSHERNRPPGIARPLELPTPVLHIEIHLPYQSIFRKERAGDHIDDNTHCSIK
jgi:hypothetical protein